MLTHKKYSATLQMNYMGGKDITLCFCGEHFNPIGAIYLRVTSRKYLVYVAKVEK